MEEAPNISNLIKDHQDSTFDKKKIDAESVPVLLQVRKDIAQPTEIFTNSEKHLSKPNVLLALKDENFAIYNKEVSSALVCRICYDEENEEKGGLIWPCTCTGSCKYIHESCLKTWIENNFSMSKIRAECEICKHPYAMKFYMKHRYSKQKLCNCIKSLGSVVLVPGIVLTLVFTVIYGVVTALSSMSEIEKKNFISIIIGIALGLLVIIVVISFKNCKKNFYEPYMNDWKIFNLDGSKK
jgi:hypothetical protein